MTFETVYVDINVLPPILLLAATAVFLFGLIKLIRK
jgi:hypothetical protein